MNSLQSPSPEKSPHPEPGGQANGSGRGLLGWLRRRSGGGRQERAERLRAKAAANAEAGGPAVVGGSRPPGGEIAMTSADAPAGRRLAKAKSVLFITADDGPTRTWRRELEEWGYSVEYAPDAEAGLDKLFDIGYDALLIDLKAPKIDGLAAIEEIRAEEHFKNLFIGALVHDRQPGGDGETAAIRAGANKAFRREDTNSEAMLGALKTALFPRVFQVQPRSRQVRPMTGPTVTPNLPSPDAAAAAAPEPSPAAARPAISLGKDAEDSLRGPSVAPKKVLIIEDDETLARVYRNQLELSGFEVEVALDGATGFHDLHTIAPHALLVDLFLPGLSGLEIIRKTRIQKRFENLPVFVFSSAYSREVEAEARAAGATHFFDKSTARPGDVIRALNEQFFPGRNQGIPTAPAPASTPAAAAPAHLPGASAQTKAISDARDDALKTEIREALLQDAPELVKSLRQSLGGFLRAHAGNDTEARSRGLLELHRRIHSLIGNAAIAGFDKTARVASALDALLREFQNRPDAINASTQRTLTQAVDFLAQLLSRPLTAEGETSSRERILVVDDEVISRRVLGHSLEKAGLQPTALDHPQAALDLLNTETFDLVFLDVEMPDMNGFDLCKKLRELPQHARTPVIFVTALNGFDSRVKSSLSGGDDFIGKPFSYIELAVKALVYVLRGRTPALANAAVAAAAK